MNERSSTHSKDPVQELLDRLPSVNASEEQIERLANLIRATAQAGSLGSARPDSRERFRITKYIWTTRIRIVYAASLMLVLFLGGAAAMKHYFMTVEEQEWIPDRVVVSDNQQVAYLVARNGRTVHAWGTPVPVGIQAGTLVRADDSGGRGNLAVLGFSQDGENPFARSYAVWQTTDLQTPIWTASLRPEDIPVDLQARPDRSYGIEQFTARLCQAEDVFPERPGSELILVFQHSVYSQCAIQVRDLDGNMLLQFWHDGNVNEVYWLSGANQLVFGAVNAEVDGSDRGQPHWWHPLVVFAIAPHHGVAPRWVNTVDHDGGIDPEWYRCIYEPESSPQGMTIRLTRPHGGGNAAAGVALNIEMPTPVGLAGFSVVLDGRGDVKPGSLLANDVYHRARRQDLLPPADAYSVEELPRIKDTSGVWLPGSRK